MLVSAGRNAIAAITMAALCACGGGGADSGDDGRTPDDSRPPVEPPPEPPAGTFDTYTVSEVAPPGRYANRDPSRVRVMVHDDALDFTREEFTGRIETEGATFGYVQTSDREARSSLRTNCSEQSRCQVFRVRSGGSWERLHAFARSVIQTRGKPPGTNWFLYDEDRYGWVRLPRYGDPTGGMGIPPGADAHGTVMGLVIAREAPETSTSGSRRVHLRHPREADGERPGAGGEPRARAPGHEHRGPKRKVLRLGHLWGGTGGPGSGPAGHREREHRARGRRSDRAADHASTAERLRRCAPAVCRCRDRGVRRLELPVLDPGRRARGSGPNRSRSDPGVQGGRGRRAVLGRPAARLGLPLLRHLGPDGRTRVEPRRRHEHPDRKPRQRLDADPERTASWTEQPAGPSPGGAERHSPRFTCTTKPPSPGAGAPCRARALESTCPGGLGTTDTRCSRREASSFPPGRSVPPTSWRGRAPALRSRNRSGPSTAPRGSPIPAGRTREGQRLYETRSFSVVPSRRTVTARVSHERKLGGGDFVASFQWTMRPGHSSGAPVGGVGAAWRLRF